MPYLCRALFSRLNKLSLELQINLFPQTSRGFFCFLTSAINTVGTLERLALDNNLNVLNERDHFLGQE